MSARERSTALAHPTVIFVAIQQDVGADGGTASLGEIITRLRHHRPVVVADRESSRVKEWRDRGVEVHVVPQTASQGFMRNPLGTLRSYWRYRRKLRSLIDSRSAEVVHANDPLAFQLALPAVRSKRAAIAFNLRGTMDPARRPPRRRYRFLFGAADHVFFLSRDMAQRWAAIAPNAKRSCSVTYSIVDPVKFVAALPPRDEPQVVLLSALIRPLKGQLEFLRHVAPRLAVNGISTWLAGDFDPSASPYMAACAEAAAPLADAVRFLGYREDIPELMKRSTVVVVASRHEGLVRAMIEAMSCGRPVVSFDISSAREMLETEFDGAGTVVEVGDYLGMTKAIIEYCRSPARASDAGQKGSAAASRLFAPDEVVARYERVYDTLSGCKQ